MDVYKLVGRNVEVTDALRDHVQKRLTRLEKFFDGIVDAKVVLHVQPSTPERKNRVEMQLNVPNGIIRAEESGTDMYVAIDAAAEMLERQLKKFRSKFIARTQQAMGRVEVPNQTFPGDEEEFEPEIVRSKRFELRPMSPEDAAVQLEALGHDFYVFTNASTQTVNVIYKRRDGHYGLIEPN